MVLLAPRSLLTSSGASSGQEVADAGSSRHS